MNKIKCGLISKYWGSAPPNNDIVDILLISILISTTMKWIYRLSLAVFFSCWLECLDNFGVEFSWSYNLLGMCSGSVSSAGSRKGKLAWQASWSMVPSRFSLWEESTVCSSLSVFQSGEPDLNAHSDSMSLYDTHWASTRSLKMKNK